MTTETKAVLFNALPLLLLAALYLAAGAALAPAPWRARWPRGRADATGLVFPCIAVAAAVAGAGVLATRQPLAGNTWVSLAVIGIAALPALALLGARRAAPATAAAPDAVAAPPLDADIRSADRLSLDLSRAGDPYEIGRLVADEAAALFRADLVEVALVDEHGRTARVVAARQAGRDVDWLLAAPLDLERETSGIGTVVAQPVPFAVFDVASSPIVSGKVTERTGVKSAAFVPVIADERAIGALVVATEQPRVFADDELSLMQAFASEAGLALARAAAAVALAEALDRERLVARISLNVRSRLDLREVLATACEETARAVSCTRCYVRLVDGEAAAPPAHEWTAEGVDALGPEPLRLPVVTLAAREGRTLAVGDVLAAPELRDPTLGDVEALVARGTRAVLATPIVAFEEVIGALALHRPEPTVWTPSEVLLVESVARELASALHTARILDESKRRLSEQTALLDAGRALTSELEFDTVIGRLVDELCRLVSADAVDCWTLLPGGRELECRAVLGDPVSTVGDRVPADGPQAEVLAAGRALVRRDEGAEGVAEAIEAPLVSFGEARGVLRAFASRPGRFGPDAVRLAEGFASLAAIALRNAETYERSARQAQVERGFSRIASVLSDPLSTEATLDAVAQAAAEALGGDAAVVLRSVGGALELAGAHELPESLAGFFLGEGEPELAVVAASGKVLASRALDTDARFGPSVPEVASEAGFRSLLAVPLTQPRSDARGLVLVFFAESHAFSDEDLELAGHVAGAARGALERSDLYELERRARSLAQRLAAAGRDLASELDPENVLERAAGHAATLVDAPAAAIWVLEGDELVVHAAAGAGSAQALEARVPSTAWLLGDIVQSRHTTAIVDASEDPRATETDPLLAAGYAAYLGVPVLGPDGGVGGVVSVYDTRPREWREEEAEALLALASSAAAARANAEQYQEVRHQQQRSDAILANVADGIVAVDREGRVVLWNTAAEHITGVPAGEAVGRTPTQVLGRSLAADGDAAAPNRLVSVRRGADDVWLSLSEAVMTDPAGAVAGRIYAFRDISAELAVEQMKSDFVSTVSHELRTPLTSIYGFAETLLRQDVLFGESERETFLRYIASESERLTAIVDRLLSVAQLDTGAMTVQIAPTDVTTVVEAAVESASQTLVTNGAHRFVVNVERDGLAAAADAEKLGQVLSHLLENAVRYSPNGGTVTVDARQVDGSVEVRVVDEGEGIPRSEHERIFRKFYRGEAASRSVGGGATGLGLFLAHGLVAAMGGRIWVDSDEGRGSTFVVALPSAEA